MTVTLKILAAFPLLIAGQSAFGQNSYPGVDSSQVYTVVEQMPVFPGGEKKVSEFLQQNIKYPSKELNAGIDGRIFIRFIVEKDGSMSNVREIKGIKGGEGLTEEAIRVIRSMPPWEPGKQNGIPVRVSLILPVKFLIPVQTPVQKTIEDTLLHLKIPEYSDSEYGFSVLMPTNLKLIDLKDSGKVFIFNRLKLVGDSQKQDGLLRYNITYRCMVEQWVPISTEGASEIYMKDREEINQQRRDTIIKICDNDLRENKVRIIKKETDTSLIAPVVTYKLEYSTRSLVEYRKIVFRDNKSFCLSYVLKSEFADENVKEKEKFFDSLKLK